MKRTSIDGYMNALLIPLIVAVITVLILAATTLVYFGKYNDASKNLDAHVATAVDEAKQQQQADDKKVFDEAEKLPLRSYATPANIGAIKISFPKTWSDYVALSAANSQTPLDFYASPDFVPAQTNDTRYALRAQLTTRAYAQIVQQYNPIVQQAKAKVAPVTLNSVQGVRIDGQIKNNIEGSMVILPIRGNTLMIWTESKNFLPDFDKNILPNLSFNP